jgi:hypothetical protein
MLTYEIGFSHERHPKPDALRNGFYDQSKVIRTVCQWWGQGTYRAIVDDGHVVRFVASLALDPERSSIPEPHRV